MLNQLLYLLTASQKQAENHPPQIIIIKKEDSLFFHLAIIGIAETQ